jgi:hypothetical protein
MDGHLDDVDNFGDGAAVSRPDGIVTPAYIPSTALRQAAVKLNEASQAAAKAYAQVRCFAGDNRAVDWREAS